MILDRIISAFNYMILMIVEAMPYSDGLSQEFTDSAYLWGGYTAILDPIVPWVTLFYCMSIIFAVELSMFAFNAFRFVIKR